MTDLEMTRLCAEAMGWKTKVVSGVPYDTVYRLKEQSPKGEWNEWNPLHDDAQAMALVKKCKLTIQREHHGDRWAVGNPHPEAMNLDLNRAIVECVAKMQKAKTPQ